MEGDGIRRPGAGPSQRDLFEEICKHCTVNPGGLISLESLFHFINEEIEVSFVDSQSLVKSLTCSLQRESLNGWIAFEDVCKTFQSWLKEQSSVSQFKIIKPKSQLSQSSIRSTGTPSTPLACSTPYTFRKVFLNDSNRSSIIEDSVYISCEMCGRDGSCCNLRSEIDSGSRDEKLRKYYEQKLDNLQKMLAQSEEFNAVLQNEAESQRKMCTLLKIKESRWIEREIQLKEREQQLTMLNNLLTEQKRSADLDVKHLRQQNSQLKTKHEDIQTQYTKLEEKSSKIAREKNEVEKVLLETESKLAHVEIDLHAKDLLVEEKEEVYQQLQVQNKELQEIIDSFEKHRCSREEVNKLPVHPILALTLESPVHNIDNYINICPNVLTENTSLHDELEAIRGTHLVPCKNISVQTVDLLASENASTQTSHLVACENMSTQTSSFMTCKNMSSQTTYVLFCNNISTQTSYLIACENVSTQTTMCSSTPVIHTDEEILCGKERSSDKSRRARDHYAPTSYMNHEDETLENAIVRYKVDIGTQTLKKKVSKRSTNKVGSGCHVTEKPEYNKRKADVEESHSFSRNKQDRIATKVFLNDEANTQISQYEALISVPCGHVKNYPVYCSTYEMELVMKADATTQVDYFREMKECACQTEKNANWIYEVSSQTSRANLKGRFASPAIQCLPGGHMYHFLSQKDIMSEALAQEQPEVNMEEEQAEAKTEMSTEVENTEAEADAQRAEVAKRGTKRARADVSDYPSELSSRRKKVVYANNGRQSPMGLVDSQVLQAASVMSSPRCRPGVSWKQTILPAASRATNVRSCGKVTKGIGFLGTNGSPLSFQPDTPSQPTEKMRLPKPLPRASKDAKSQVLYECDSCKKEENTPIMVAAEVRIEIDRPEKKMEERKTQTTEQSEEKLSRWSSKHLLLERNASIETSRRGKTLSTLKLSSEKYPDSSGLSDTQDLDMKMSNSLQQNESVPHSSQGLSQHMENINGSSEDIFLSTEICKSNDTYILHPLNGEPYLENIMEITDSTHVSVTSSDLNSSYIRTIKLILQKLNVKTTNDTCKIRCFQKKVKKFIQRTSTPRYKRLVGLLQKPKRTLVSLFILSLLWWFFFAVMTPSDGNECTMPFTMARVRKIFNLEKRYIYPNGPPPV